MLRPLLRRGALEILEEGATATAGAPQSVGGCHGVLRQLADLRLQQVDIARAMLVRVRFEVAQVAGA